jgi:hypothetical protein
VIGKTGNSEDFVSSEDGGAVVSSAGSDCEGSILKIFENPVIMRVRDSNK